MKFLHSRYVNCREILESYSYPQPFILHLKQYFRQHKKFGSRDRREITHICFTALRTGLLYREYGINEALLFSFTYLYPDNEEVETMVSTLSSLKLNNDFKSLCLALGIDQPFYKSKLQEDYARLNEAENFGFQPKVWLKNSNLDKATPSKIVEGAEFVEQGIEVPPQVQIQDLSSQFLCSKIEINPNEKVWDCCAASGGKSLNLSASSNAQFYLSDNRAQSIENAKRRLKDVPNTQFAVFDAIKGGTLSFNTAIEEQYFDRIIADVPCSGSGTWFRNPEHFAYFNYNDIGKYMEQQQKIVTSTMKFLKSGGLLHYMTCSVFEEENRDQVLFFSKELNLELLESYGFCGLEYGADSMYMATFKKK